MNDPEMISALNELESIKATRRRVAMQGGVARAAALSKRQRSASARKAGIASGAARARKAKENAK